MLVCFLFGSAPTSSLAYIADFKGDTQGALIAWRTAQTTAVAPAAPAAGSGLGNGTSRTRRFHRIRCCPVICVRPREKMRHNLTNCCHQRWLPGRI